MKTIWIVRYSNYEPAEVDSYHETEESAKIRADALGFDYNVEEVKLENLSREGQSSGSDNATPEGGKIKSYQRKREEPGA